VLCKEFQLLPGHALTETLRSLGSAVALQTLPPSSSVQDLVSHLAVEGGEGLRGLERYVENHPPHSDII
jgi:hypothetical protein